jgi:hypothetical protein
MGTVSTWNKRREAIRARIADPEGAYPRCVVLDCDQRTMAHARQGLNKHYCRRHVEHYRRHGSYSKPSYPPRELNPRRRTAHRWLQAHLNAPEVREAVDRVRTLYWRAGRVEEAFRLAGKPPAERAKNVWGRLRETQVDPTHVLAVWLAVELRHRADMQPERRVEFRRVQAAKVLHRLAGGSHKRWERERDNGTVEVTELHKYPASRGLVLRQSGRLLAWAAAPLDQFLSAVESIHGHSRSSARAPSVRPRIKT